MSNERILLSPPHLTGGEKALIEAALCSGWIALLGPQVDAFESELASATGNNHALAVVSGTAAIHLALLVVGVGPGDVVLCSTLTFIASAAPIRYCGAEPVFVDSTPETWNMCPVLLEEAIVGCVRSGSKPKAVVVVDIFGQSADYEPILEVCNRYEIPVIEDAAEALGGTYKNQPIGSFGLISVLSFNGNKIVTTSGGGAFLSNDVELIEKASFLANQAQDPAPHYEHSVIGYNYRLSNLLAAVGRAQLDHLGERVKAKRQIFSRYEDGLRDMENLSFMPESEYGRATRWLSVITVDGENSEAIRDRVLAGLKSEGIEARPIWKPMHLQPVFSQCRHYGGEISQRLFESGLCLPSGTSMSTEDQQRVIDCVRRHVS